VASGRELQDELRTAGARSVRGRTLLFLLSRPTSARSSSGLSCLAAFAAASASCERATQQTP
jgi:hypothetical protein